MSSIDEKKIEAIAKVCHETNRAYCQTIGDDSQPTWENAPEWQRMSAIDGVKFRLLNPEAGPEASHENWCRQKLNDGWKFGPVKDPEKKEHPCLTLFTKLSPEQQKKDHLFLGVVKALAW